MSIRILYASYKFWEVGGEIPLRLLRECDTDISKNQTSETTSDKKYSKSGGKPDTGLFSRSGFGWTITGNPRTKNGGGGTGPIAHVTSI